MKRKSCLLLSLFILLLPSCSRERDGGYGQCEHDWAPWDTLEEPTCSKRGTKIRTCILCGCEEQKSIPLDQEAHFWVRDASNDREATCMQNGIHGSKKCKYCGEIVDGTDSGKADHEFIYMQPQPEGFCIETCTHEGVYFEKCTCCGLIVQKTTPKRDHYFEYVEKSGCVQELVCKECNLHAYDLDITEAQGWNRTGKFIGREAPNNKSTWNIENKIPAGKYDIQLKAMFPLTIYEDYKYYNMAKPGLATEEDIELNNTNEYKDLANEDDYRYTIKVDEQTYVPQTKDNFETIGYGGADMHTDYFEYGRFVDEIVINEDTRNISLCHGDISGVPLTCSNIMLISCANGSN